MEVGIRRIRNYPEFTSHFRSEFNQPICGFTGNGRDHCASIDRDCYPEQLEQGSLKTFCMTQKVDIVDGKDVMPLWGQDIHIVDVTCDMENSSF